MTLANSGCYEILMPDVKYIGGPDAVRALIPVLESLNFKMTLHNPNGIIATAHRRPSLCFDRFWGAHGVPLWCCGAAGAFV